MKCTYIGLCNKGEKYKLTRHNAGRILLSHILQKNQIEDFDDAEENKIQEREFVLGGESVVFVAPATFMNSSGGTVKKYRDPETMIVVVYDDIDLPFGELRLSYNKSGGSHNGVLSVVKSLATQKFVTLRVGVSPLGDMGNIHRPTGRGVVERFVLKDFTHDELKSFEELAGRAEKIMVLLGSRGLEKTLSVYKS